MAKHEHFWLYESACYSGRTNGECAVHRWCDCGVHQVSYTAGKWVVPRQPKWDVDALKLVAKEADHAE